MSTTTPHQTELTTDTHCPHKNRTMDEDVLLCFECYMAQYDGTSFTMNPEGQ